MTKERRPEVDKALEVLGELAEVLREAQAVDAAMRVDAAVHLVEAADFLDRGADLKWLPRWALDHHLERLTFTSGIADQDVATIRSEILRRMGEW